MPVRRRGIKVREVVELLSHRMYKELGLQMALGIVTSNMLLCTLGTGQLDDEALKWVLDNFKVYSTSEMYAQMSPSQQRIVIQRNPLLVLMFNRDFMHLC